MKEQLHANRIQLTYANVLSWTSTLGMIFVAAGYVIYVFQLLPSAVSPAEIAMNWHLRAAELHKAVPVPSGWDWVTQLGRGDVLSYLSIIYLSSVTMLCLVVIIPLFFREKDRIYTLIALLQVLVLVFAATGIISGGH
ncbi:DUF1634 domain-containing protein [Pelodictyon phaeoclathratiforme]|jgi:hypothetical protein|uniref:DUF1634 domain-containing protein n=1 Tax=Pelodictyon phaeoclathratiforme (strain DSM 5477 / BU-1) TaxID=324925 RepID=B4SEA3_PELPB|nr:DUF1634 domain-containing protein [Pelodictyon phaeoclathratiforme]ACF44522.1 conserved hypothetical protein [Pelodictyon phaeoclathratiforme BU-1]MBV5290138.1 DUF1634 domain-containing protein [Pelodictyon phaeoclathratiforme]